MMREEETLPHRKKSTPKPTQKKEGGKEIFFPTTIRKKIATKYGRDIINMKAKKKKKRSRKKWHIHRGDNNQDI